MIRDWVITDYHRRDHDGLAVADWPNLALCPNEMHAIGIAKAGILRLSATPELVFEFLAVRWRTIQHYGVEVDGLRYNGVALDGYRNTRSPYGGVSAGKWPIRVNSDDVRLVYFQDPDDDRWHRLEWEHAALLGSPFSSDAARYARRLAVRTDRFADPAETLAEVLDRWSRGAVTGRRERRIAARLSAERAAIPAAPGTPFDGLPDPDADLLPEGPDDAGILGDDDSEDELSFDADGFYDDALEVLE